MCYMTNDHNLQSKLKEKQNHKTLLHFKETLFIIRNKEWNIFPRIFPLLSQHQFKILVTKSWLVVNIRLTQNKIKITFPSSRIF